MLRWVFTAWVPSSTTNVVWLGHAAPSYALPQMSCDISASDTPQRHDRFLGGKVVHAKVDRSRLDLQMSSVVVASVYGYTLLHRELALTLSPSCCFLWEPADNQSNACVVSYEPRGAMQGDALIQTQQDIKSIAYLSSSTVCKSLCQMRIMFKHLIHQHIFPLLCQVLPISSPTRDMPFR